MWRGGGLFVSTSNHHRHHSFPSSLQHSCSTQGSFLFLRLSLLCASVSFHRSIAGSAEWIRRGLNLGLSSSTSPPLGGNFLTWFWSLQLQFSLFFSLFVSFFFFFSFFNFFLVYFALLRVVNVCINGNRILNLVFRLSPCFSGFLDLFEVRVFDADAIELSWEVHVMNLI